MSIGGISWAPLCQKPKALVVSKGPNQTSLGTFPVPYSPRRMAQPGGAIPRRGRTVPMGAKRLQNRSDRTETWAKRAKRMFVAGGACTENAPWTLFGVQCPRRGPDTHVLEHPRATRSLGTWVRTDQEEGVVGWEVGGSTKGSTLGFPLQSSNEKSHRKQKGFFSTMRRCPTPLSEEGGG